MRSALLVLLALSFPAAATAQAPIVRAGDRAFVEVETPRDIVYVGEPFRVRLRIGFDRRFFETSVVPMFRRPMDVALHVRAPWLDNLPGLTPLAPPVRDRSAARRSFALDDDVVDAIRTEDRLVDGRTFTVLVLERVYLPARPGEILTGATRLSFAYGTEFEEDFVQGRRATDRREASVVSPPLAIRVLPLPAEGRPDSFTGAVGRYRLEAEADGSTVEVGESLRLTLRIEGRGNLGSFEPPDLQGLDGFHVLGRIDDRGSPVRTIAYDLAPLGVNVTRVPPIPLSFFDPGPPPGYHVVRSRPIPIEVHARPGAGPDEVSSPVRPATPAEPSGREIPPGLIAGAIVLAVVLGSYALLAWRRARRRPDPAEEHARRALDAFRSAGTDADLAETFAVFLSTHLHCPAAAVITPDLATRLAAAGVARDLANRTASRLESLVAARYGGKTSATDAAAARALVDELDAAFRSARPG